MVRPLRINVHWHAIVQTPDANLSAGLQWVGQSYSSWFNARHNRVGEAETGRAETSWDGIAIGGAEFVVRMKDLAGHPDRSDVGGADYSAISKGLRRFERRLGKDASLRRSYKRLCNMLNAEM